MVWLMLCDIKSMWLKPASRFHVPVDVKTCIVFLLLLLHYISRIEGLVIIKIMTITYQSLRLDWGTFSIHVCNTISAGNFLHAWTFYKIIPTPSVYLLTLCLVSCILALGARLDFLADYALSTKFPAQYQNLTDS